MAIAPTRLTLDEFLSLPDDEPALEFHNGTVTHKVTPKLQHGALRAELIKRIDESAVLRRTARAFRELRATFAGASLVPDVAVYLWERIPVGVDGPLADDVFEPPDIAVEIASPGQGANPLTRRCLWYAGNGVRIALLVDPSDESVLAFRPGGDLRPLEGSDRIDINEIVPG